VPLVMDSGLTPSACPGMTILTCTIYRPSDEQQNEGNLASLDDQIAKLRLVAETARGG